MAARCTIFDRGGGDCKAKSIFRRAVRTETNSLFFGGGEGTFGHSPLHMGEYIIVFLVLGSPMILYQIINIKKIPCNNSTFKNKISTSLIELLLVKPTKFIDQI